MSTSPSRSAVAAEAAPRAGAGGSGAAGSGAGEGDRLHDRSEAADRGRLASGAGVPVPPAPRLDAEDVRRLRAGRHHDPHGLLGAHPRADGLVVRVFRPWATAVEVLTPDAVYTLPMEAEGLYGGVLPVEGVVPYRLRVQYGTTVWTGADSYAFLPTLGSLDLHLIAEGRHEELWRVLGAHVRTVDDGVSPVTGVSFAVWAPNAEGVRVVGDFNYWDGQAHLMRSLGSSGVWELFVPDVAEGTRYKYEITGRDGVLRQKADPMAFATEVPPATGSVVHHSRYTWNDTAWLDRRSLAHPHAEPMSIYEVHLGSWRQGLGYRELAEELTTYVTELGFTHVELLPVAEHPFGGSWGYQVSSYYAPTSRFGSPDEFRHLVDRLHQAGIGVIIDWVPAHFPRDDWALARFDGTPLYEHPDPRIGEHPDWGTYVFDYGRREVRNFLVANAVFWCEEFHIDGLRVDAVASMLYLDYSRGPGQWTPNVHGGRENLDAVAFLQEMNATVYRRCPGVVTIAEESTAWSGVTRATAHGGLGFGFKWNMGWMHDSLGYVAHDPIHRQYHHHEMTFAMVYAYSENYILPISHDEVVHGKGALVAKMPGDQEQRQAGVRAFLAFMWAHPGKQLLFMGSEFAQEQEWSESRSLDWDLLQYRGHRGVRELVADLNRTYRDHRALWELDTSPSGFSWIDADNAGGNIFAFLRQGIPAMATGDPQPPRPALVCVVNFSGGAHESYRVGLPSSGRWRELLNTDSALYGGGNVGNLGHVTAEERPWHGQPYSTTLRVPALGAVWLTPEP